MSVEVHVEDVEKKTPLFDVVIETLILGDLVLLWLEIITLVGWDVPVLVELHVEDVEDKTTTLLTKLFV